MSPHAVSLPDTRIHRLHADAVGDDFELWIATPQQGFVPSLEAPRVLYVLDANLFFGTAVEMTRLMHQLFGELPPLLVVGIGYDSPSPAVQAELRTRDFTPTVDSGFAKMARAMPGAPEPTLPEGRRLGRADEFLRFLVQEARPFVEARYEVAVGGSVLFGSSLGGLFVLHSLLKQPGAFDAYIASSPAIWWDGACLLDREEEVAREGSDLAASLYMAVGEHEERAEIPMLSRFRLVSNLRLLAERLAGRGYDSLDLDSAVIGGETHTSVVPAALTRGLRHALRGWARSPAPPP